MKQINITFIEKIICSLQNLNSIAIFDGLVNCGGVKLEAIEGSSRWISETNMISLDLTMVAGQLADFWTNQDSFEVTISSLGKVSYHFFYRCLLILSVCYFRLWTLCI